MLLTRLLSRPAKPEANEKKRMAAKRLHPEYDARIKQTASPVIPLKFMFSNTFLQEHQYYQLL